MASSCHARRMQHNCVFICLCQPSRQHHDSGISHFVWCSHCKHVLAVLSKLNQYSFKLGAYPMLAADSIACTSGWILHPSLAKAYYTPCRSVSSRSLHGSSTHCSACFVAAAVGKNTQHPDCAFALQVGNAEDVAKYAKRTVRVTQQHNDECKRLLELMGVPIINVSFPFACSDCICSSAKCLQPPWFMCPMHKREWAAYFLAQKCTRSVTACSLFACVAHAQKG